MRICLINDQKTSYGKLCFNNPSCKINNLGSSFIDPNDLSKEENPNQLKLPEVDFNYKNLNKFNSLNYLPEV